MEMRFQYAVIIFLLMGSVVFAQTENVTNATGNETSDEVDYVEEGKNIVEGMYDNYKGIMQSISRALNIEQEAISAILAIAVIFLLLGKRARKYMFYILIIFFLLWIIGMV